MATQIRTPVAAIVRALKDLVMAKLSFPSERVILTQSNRMPENQSDVVIYMRVRRMVEIPQFADGAGNYDDRVMRVIDIAPRIRLDTDSESDEKWLMDTDLGYFHWEQRILEAVTGDFTEDSDGNALLCDTIKLMGATEAQKFPDAPGWGEGMLSFKIVHQLDLDLTK